MTKNTFPETNFDLLPFACIVISEDNQIIFINTFMEKFINPEGNNNFIGQSIFDIIASEEHGEFQHFLQMLDLSPIEQQWKVFQMISQDQTEKQFLLNASKYHVDTRNESAILLAGLPYSELVLNSSSNIQEEQNRSDRFTEDKFKNIFQNATIGMAVLNNSGFLEEANPSFIEHIDLAKSAVINRHYTEVFIDQAKDKLRTLFGLLNDNRQPYVKDVIAFKSAGDQHKIFEVSLSKIYDECENCKKFMLFTEDITNQQDTHRALLQSEKLALTGRLAASLAHEINNPLQTSLGCLGLVEEMLDDDDEDLAVFINMATEELKRSARIVKKLRDLNRSTDMTERMAIDLREMIEGVLVLTKNHLFDRNIVPVLSYQGPPPIIHAARDQIQQVILNLMMNAIDELQGGGNIYLDIVMSDDSQGITIKIRDTGNGIDPEIINNIFDPFFTTKDDGIGLGLYICKQIIENHSGSLQVISEPGEGTEFSIWLPNPDPLEEKES